VKDLPILRLELDEDLWIDDWNDPGVVAASLALTGEIDPGLFTPPAAA
jgi:hypothetical protein